MNLRTGSTNDRSQNPSFSGASWIRFAMKKPAIYWREEVGNGISHDIRGARKDKRKPPQPELALCTAAQQDEAKMRTLHYIFI